MLTKKAIGDIISPIFINAMKELRVFVLTLQRVGGCCEPMCFKNSVSFRSRVSQPPTVYKKLRKPRYHGYRLFRVLMSDCFSSNRGGAADFSKIRP